MSGHYRLRLTRDSALRLAEWRQQQGRRARATERAWDETHPAESAKRPSIRKLYVLWSVLGLLVLVAILGNWVWAGFLNELIVLPYLLAAVLAFGGAFVHAYTFESGIWKGLRTGAFPATSFGPPDVTRALQRVVWQFHTVSWLATAGLLGWYALVNLAPPFAPDVVTLLAGYWIAIIAASVVVTLLSVKPRDYFVLKVGAFQWLYVGVMVLLMFFGNGAFPVLKGWTLP